MCVGINKFVIRYMDIAKANYFGDELQSLPEIKEIKYIRIITHCSFAKHR